MNTEQISDSGDMLTPAEFLVRFLSPKTVEGRCVIEELDKETTREALDLASFFTENDTKQLFNCPDPKKCFLLIRLMIERIRWEQAEAHMSPVQKQQTLERFYRAFSGRQ